MEVCGVQSLGVPTVREEVVRRASNAFTTGYFLTPLRGNTAASLFLVFGNWSASKLFSGILRQRKSSDERLRASNQELHGAFWRLVGEQTDGVWNVAANRREVFNCAARAAGQIDDQGAAANAAHGA